MLGEPEITVSDPLTSQIADPCSRRRRTTSVPAYPERQPKIAEHEVSRAPHVGHPFCARTMSQKPPSANLIACPPGQINPFVSKLGLWVYHVTKGSLLMVLPLLSGR